MPDCQTCGEVNPSGFRFCGHCGGSLRVPRLTGREERKVVSILFCDLVGFTSVSDSADPEDVRSRIRPYHQLLRTEIARFGGTIEKFIGDAVMAVFGAPSTHEDDAERAVRAGLRIVEAIQELNESHPGLELSVRIGVETGEVVVVLGAKPEEGEGIVAGYVVNTASRLQAVAPVGGVGVGIGTYDLTREIFDYEVLPPVIVKGVAQPVAIFHATAARSRLGIDLSRGDPGAFVGREVETRLLQGIFERAAHDGSVQLVTIIGEPGIGKSRQVGELAAQLDAQPDLLVRWRQGRCLPYGDGVTFWALGEIVKAEAGILDTDDPDVARRKLRRSLPASDLDREWMFQRLLPLLGVEATSTADREESFVAWRRFLEHLASDGPTILVFEDLHWADDALLAFLEHVVEYSEDVPLMLIATARPELFERQPSWASTARNANRINLAPLSEFETSSLVSGLLGQALLPAEMHATIMDRVGGNPFYAEEFIRLLKDREMLRREGSTWRFDTRVDIPLPDGIRGLIAARLDTLSPERKAVLQDASVLGKVFWTGALVEMTGLPAGTIDAHMHELSRKELVRKARTPSIGGEREYAFWHLLVRDVCYSQIPRAGRAAKHVAAATWIEEMAGARIEDHAEILASHYSEALDMFKAVGDAEGAGAAAQASLRHLLVAGERLLGLDVESGRTYLSRALELAGRDHPRWPEVLMAWGDAEQQSGHIAEAAAAFEEVVTVYRERDDPHSAALGLMKLYVALWIMGDPRGTEMAAEAVSLLEPEPPGPDLVAAYTELGVINLLNTEFRDAVEWTSRALDLAEKLGIEEPHKALGYRGAARALLGDVDGIDDLRGAIKLATDRGRGKDAAMLYHNLAGTIIAIEGPAAALDVTAAGIAFSERRGISEAADAMACASLELMVAVGRWDEALSMADELEGRVDPSDMLSHLQIRLVRAQVLLLRGQATEALPLARANVEAADVFLQAAPPAFTGAAAVYASLGDRAAALALLNRLDQLPKVREGDMYAEHLPQATRTALSLGDAELAERLMSGLEKKSLRVEHALATARAALSESQGDLNAAADGYEDAAHRWRTFGVVPEVAFALLGKGRSLVELGRGPDATSALREALDMFTSLGAGPSAEECDRFLGITD